MAKEPVITSDAGKTLKRGAIGCLIALAVLIGLVIFNLARPSGDPGPSGYEAVVYCENKIEERLVSPSSADFKSSFQGTNPFTVTGTVDSENSFGASLRSEYQCTVQIHEDSVTVTVDYLR